MLFVYKLYKKSVCACHKRNDANRKGQNNKQTETFNTTHNIRYISINIITGTNHKQIQQTHTTQNIKGQLT